MKKLIYFSVFFLVLIFAFISKDKITIATTYQAPTATLRADSYSITSGSSTTLRWSSTNATSCTSNFGSIDTFGAQSVSPETTTTYTIDCTDGIENGTAGATVTVTTPPPPPQQPLCPGNYQADTGYRWVVTQQAGRDTQHPDQCSPTSADPVAVCGATTLNSSGYWYHWSDDWNVNSYYNCEAIPPAPTIALEAAAGACLSHTIYLSWNVPTGATTFVLQRDGTTIYTGGATSFSDTTVTAGTTYNYSITAKNSNGSTIASDSSSAVGPTDLCENLSITAITPSNTTTILPSGGGSLPLGADFIWSGANYFIDFGITLSKTDNQGTTPPTTIYYGPSVHNNNAGGDITFSSSYNYPASTQTTGTTTYTFTYTGLAKSSEQSIGSEPSFTRTIIVPAPPLGTTRVNVRSNTLGSAFTINGTAYTQQGTTYTTVSNPAPYTYSVTYSPMSGYSVSAQAVTCTNGINCTTTTNLSQTLSESQTMTVDITYTPLQQPDLTAGGVSVNPTSPTAGQSATLSATITNGGSASTGSSVFSNIIQIATASNGGGTVSNYPTNQTGPLAAGGTASISTSYTFPSAGTYSARACADNPPTVTESDDTNNCGVWTNITVQSVPPTIDVTASGVSVNPTSPTAGQSATLSATITNSGTGSTGTAFTSKIQVATASNGGGTITNNPSSSVGPLASGGNGNTSITYTFPSPGTYSARACADLDGNSLVESDENNNCGVWTNITVQNPPQTPTDLTVSTPTVDSPNLVDPAYERFTSTISNSGIATNTTFQNKFQLSDQSNGQGTITNLVVSPDASGIGANGSVDITYTYHFSQSGNYSIRACADSSSVVTEANEANNCGAWFNYGFTMPVYSPDLTAGTVNQSSAIADQASSYTATIYNNGYATSGSTGFTNKLQKATDINGTGAVKIADSNSMSGLGAVNGQSTATFSGVILTEGTWYLRACADLDGNAISEDNASHNAEGNNCGAWTPVTVSAGQQVQQPDLTAGAVAPTSAAPGSAQTYTATITNSGTTSTGATTFTNSLQRATDNVGTNSTEIKTATMSNIGAGASGPASFSSVTLTEGTWYLRACADTGNNIAESNNNNNCGAWTQVNVTSPNAPVINFLANPAEINPNQSSKLTWTTQNASSCLGNSSPSYMNWTGTSKGTTNTTGENVTPTQTTTFILSCTGNGYHSTSTQVVTVTVPTTIATITVTSSRATGWTLTGVAIDGSSDYRDTMTNTTTKTYSVDTKGGMIFNLDAAPITNNSVTITNTVDPRSGSSMTLYGGEHVTYNIFYSENSPMEYTLTNSGTSQATKSGYNTPVPAQSTIYAHLLRGTTQPVTISHGALPQGVTVESISNQGCSPDCAFVVNMLVASNAPAGSYPISIAGSPNATTTVFYLQVLQGGLLRVDCAPSSPVALVGQSVIWSANVSGGTAPYTYSWTGTGISTTTPPTTNPYEIRYSTTGVKNAYVSVRDSVGNNAVCNTSNVRVNFVPKFEEF